MEGCLNALKGHEIELHEKLVIYIDYIMEGGYIAVKKLPGLAQRPTAAFVTNYEITSGAIIALNEAQINIPDDMIRYDCRLFKRINAAACHGLS